MRFIFRVGHFANFREEYQIEKNVNFDEKSSFFGLPKFFGGIDFDNRNKQTLFLKKIHTLLKPNLLSKEEIRTPQQREATLTASRIYIAACLYVISQLNRNSVLLGLIKKELGITQENYLDDEDQMICFFAARRVLTSSLSVYTDANIALRRANLPPLNEIEWSSFLSYVHQASNKTTSLPNPYLNYPVTSITQPIFGLAFRTVGTAVRRVTGEILAQSPLAFKVTTLAGTAVLAFGVAGPSGLALLTPIVAEKLISKLCRFTLTQALAISMEYLGKAAGTAIGLPFDLSYYLLRNACSLIGSYCAPEDLAMISGMRIADGCQIVNGLVMEFTTLEELPSGYEKKLLEIKDDGSLYMDNQLLLDSSDDLLIPAEFITELKEQCSRLDKLRIEEITANDSNASLHF